MVSDAAESSRVETSIELSSRDGTAVTPESRRRSYYRAIVTSDAGKRIVANESRSLSRGSN